MIPPANLLQQTLPNLDKKALWAELDAYCEKLDNISHWDALSLSPQIREEKSHLYMGRAHINEQLGLQYEAVQDALFAESLSHGTPSHEVLSQESEQLRLLCGTQRLQKAIQAEKAGNLDTCLDEYKAASSNLPKADRPEVYLKIVSLSDDLGLNSREWRNSCFDTLLDRARERQQAGQFEAALSDSNTAIQLCPTAPNGYRVRASIYSDLGRNPEADAELNKAYVTENTKSEINTGTYVNSDILANDSFELVERAAARSRLGDTAGALRDFDKALQKDASPYAYEKLGDLKVKLGDLEGATAAYSRSSELVHDLPKKQQAYNPTLDTPSLDELRQKLERVEQLRASGVEKVSPVDLPEVQRMARELPREKQLRKAPGLESQSDTGAPLTTQVSSPAASVPAITDLPTPQWEEPTGLTENLARSEFASALGEPGDALAAEFQPSVLAMDTLLPKSTREATVSLAPSPDLTTSSQERLPALLGIEAATEQKIEASQPQPADKISLPQPNSQTRDQTDKEGTFKKWISQVSSRVSTALNGAVDSLKTELQKLSSQLSFNTATERGGAISRDEIIPTPPPQGQSVSTTLPVVEKNENVALPVQSSSQTDVLPIQGQQAAYQVHGEVTAKAELSEPPSPESFEQAPQVDLSRDSLNGKTSILASTITDTLRAARSAPESKAIEERSVQISHSTERRQDEQNGTTMAQPAQVTSVAASSPSVEVLMPEPMAQGSLQQSEITGSIQAVNEATQPLAGAEISIPTEPMATLSSSPIQSTSQQGSDRDTAQAATSLVSRTANSFLDYLEKDTYDGANYKIQRQGEGVQSSLVVEAKDGRGVLLTSWGNQDNPWVEQKLEPTDLQHFASLDTFLAEVAPQQKHALSAPVPGYPNLDIE